MSSVLASSRDDDGRVPDFTPRNPNVAIEVGTHAGEPLVLLKAHRGTPWALAHRCDRGRRGVIRCAPVLTDHSVHVIAAMPEGGGSVDVSPSVLCPDCGLHGWITGGHWSPA